MSAMTYTAPSKSSGIAVAAAWVLALLLIVALAGATYIYLNEHSKVRDLQQENQQLQAGMQHPASSSQPSDNSDNNQAQVGNTYKSDKGTVVTVYQPTSDDKVSSPLGVIGQAPGRWSFEGSFPVLLKDANNKILVKSTAKMQGNWMTDSDVPFAASLMFDQPSTPTGTLVLQKDNPSGLTQNDDSVSIPVKF